MSTTVTVTATDPFGATVTSVVTITVTDVNEDPTVMGAASIDHAENNDATVTALDIDAENQPTCNLPNTPPPTRTAMMTLLPV